jgi:hypothetical protein
MVPDSCVEGSLQRDMITKITVLVAVLGRAILPTGSIYQLAAAEAPLGAPAWRAHAQLAIEVDLVTP